MRMEHRALAERWFERLLDLIPVEARDVFPTESLLDHIPGLILEISAYLREPEDAAIAANTAILDKARELGALRHSQRASLHQVLREYQLLGGVLVNFVLEEMRSLGTVPSAADSVSLVFRLTQAVNVLSQSTVEAFVSLYTQTIAEQNQRLEQFTRMAAHEWRQPLGALQFGVSLLRQPKMDSRTVGADIRRGRAECPSPGRPHAQARSGRARTDQWRQPRRPGSVRGNDRPERRPASFGRWRTPAASRFRLRRRSRP
jgi:signal transduction histidine kinase